MSATLLFLLAVASTGTFAPEPTRSFLSATTRVGATAGAMYFMTARVHSAPMPVPPPRVVPAKPPPKPVPAPMPVPTL